MQSSNNNLLVEELARVSTLTPHTSKILKKLLKDTPHSPLLEQTLVSLTCQTKNLCHYKTSNPSSHQDEAISLIVELLSKLSKNSERSAQHISTLFITHLLSHTSCFVCCGAFWNLLNQYECMLEYVGFEQLIEIASKVEKYGRPHDLKILQGIQIEKEAVFAPRHIELCARNLENYLRDQAVFAPSVEDSRKSGSATRPQGHPLRMNTTLTSTISKIPPLILPTSKTIQSSRYSAVSRQQKRKGLSDLKKLAHSLGEGFISVELGCLLSNKRTKQIQQFSQNEAYRLRCLQKLERIETERMNSSRLSSMSIDLHLMQQDGATQGQPQGSGFQKKSGYEQSENSHIYYRKVLQSIANIFYSKISYQNKQDPSIKASQINKKKGPNNKKTKTSQQNTHPNKETKQLEEHQLQATVRFTQQLIDMILVGIVRIHQHSPAVHPNNLTKIIPAKEQPSELSLREVMQRLMEMISLQSEQLHMNMLLNRGKTAASYHYDISQSVTIEQDEFIAPVEIGRNSYVKFRGSYMLPGNPKANNYSELKKGSDPILFHLATWLQSLLESADLNHPHFQPYQATILEVLAFYVAKCGCRVTPFYICEYIFPLLLLVKRQIVELCHPYLPNPHSPRMDDPSKSWRKQKRTQPLYCEHHESLQNLLQILDSLLGSGHKHVEKLLANTFFRNVYFMEVLEGYVVWLFKAENVPAITPILRLYRHVIEIYKVWATKKSSGPSNFGYVSFLYQHLEGYLCPKNGCIAKVLSKYESYISPSCLDDSEADIYQQQNHFRYVNLIEYQQSRISHTSAAYQFFNSGDSANKHPHNMAYIHSFLHNICAFLADIYSLTTSNLLSAEHSLILEQDTASFYIKFSLINFIKLYSLITVTELVKMNSGAQTQSYPSGRLQQMGLLSTKQSPHSNLHKVNTKQIFMIDFLKILTSISLNRTPQIGKKIRQYRVVEFFTREIELEFSVLQNVEKYIKKAAKLRDIGDILKVREQVSKQLQMKKDAAKVKKKQSRGSTSSNPKRKKSLGRPSKPSKRKNHPPSIMKLHIGQKMMMMKSETIGAHYSNEQSMEDYSSYQIHSEEVSSDMENYDQQPSDDQSIDPAALMLNLGGVPRKDTGNIYTQPASKKPKIPGLNLTGELFHRQDKEKTTNQQELNNSQGASNKQIVEQLPIAGQKNKKPAIPSLKIPVRTEESQSGHKSRVDSSESNSKKQKGYLDDLLDEIMLKEPHNDMKKRRKSIKTDQGVLKLPLDMGMPNASDRSAQLHLNNKNNAKSERNIIYSTERKIRKIYSSKQLHSECIMLILSLILHKGQLDPLYCDEMPIMHGKLNVLYILHHHLNHQSNRSIIPLLAESVNKIQPYLAGQRLLKLLSTSFTDLSQYQNWTKISAGAYGVVMAAETGLQKPAQVAIKQMNFPKSIYGSCVLHSIFTEISCLEMFRLEDRVTRIYNYGIADNTYVIVMKKYACSLRDWRLSTVDSPEIRLFPPTLPNILAIFYEILKGLKLLHEHNVTHYDIKGDNIMLDFIPSKDPKEPPKVEVVFGDFGVCKLFDDEKEELDLKSRGTECIKSPEMLTLSLKNKKQSESFDRRKKIGTTRASDIWSLGCLFYEIVVGDFLFHDNNWTHFFVQVTSPDGDLLKEENYRKMNDNVYLIDFLKYILIRDPHHRPSIHNILSRFQNLYQLLVTNPLRTASEDLRLVRNKSIDELVSEYCQFIDSQEKTGWQGRKGKRMNKTDMEIQSVERGSPKYAGKMMKIMEDIYLCERETFVSTHEDKIRDEGISHIIMEAGPVASSVMKAKKILFKVMEIHPNEQNPRALIYKLCPRVSDMLRQVLLLKGKLLFVNSESNYCVNLLIFTLSYWFRCSAYQTWCLINTQILTFPSFTSSITPMSKGLSILNDIEKQVSVFPKLQCICGSVTIIMKTFQERKGQLRACRCKKKNSQCFTKNCPKYLEFLSKRFNIAWDHLTWALIQQEQLLTPLIGITHLSSRQERDYRIRSQIILNSADPLSNMVIDEDQSPVWKVMQCKVCEMWMLAVNQQDGQIWVILNNLIKSCRQGIMIPNAQQDFKSKTPALNFYTLSKLHMTSQ